jgi:ATP-dependent DNA ligase
MLRKRVPAGFVEPCLPSPIKSPPSGPGWIHEIKHDGFRIMARRDARGVRLITRQGYDFTKRFPAAVKTLEALKVRSCLIDGEVIVTDASGLAVFDQLRRTNGHEIAVLCAFDLIELDGEDLRLMPIEDRKTALRRLLKRATGRDRLQRDLRRRRHHHLPASLQARLRGHRVEALRVAVPVRTIGALVQDQKSGIASRAPGGRDRMAPVRETSK